MSIIFDTLTVEGLIKELEKYPKDSMINLSLMDDSYGTGESTLLRVGSDPKNGSTVLQGYLEKYYETPDR